MATTRFYAAGVDEIRVMEFVFAETDCEVWQSYSAYDQPLRRFDSVGDLERASGLGGDRVREDRSLALCLWSPSVGGRLVASRIDLKVKGATFREKADGWGLVHIHFGASDGAAVLPEAQAVAKNGRTPGAPSPPSAT